MKIKKYSMWLSFNSCCCVHFIPNCLIDFSIFIMSCNCISTQIYHNSGLTIVLLLTSLRRVVSPINDGLPHSTVLHSYFDAFRVPFCVLFEDVYVRQGWSTRFLVFMFWCPEDPLGKSLETGASLLKQCPTNLVLLNRILWLIFGRLPSFVVCCFQLTSMTVFSMCV